MEPLINAIRAAAPIAINEFNTERLPHLEQALGRSIVDEFPDPRTRTAEATKTMVRVIDNTFYRHIHELAPTFVEDEGAGCDNKFGDTPIEGKCTFGKGGSWTGNGFDKTGWHLLKKFGVNDHGRINSCFIALVNLDECESKWSERTIKSHFSSLHLRSVDASKVHVIIGSLKTNPKNLVPVLAPV